MQASFLTSLAPTRGLRALALGACALLCAAVALGKANAQSSVPDTRYPVTNDVVRSTAQSGDTLFLGGAFRYIGANTGSGAIFRIQNGALARPRMPRVVGTVYCAQADGEGGWFIGGLFDSINGSYRKNLGHVLATGVLDAWAPNPNGAVWAMERMDSNLYVGGGFGSIAGSVRTRLAAFDSLDVLLSLNLSVSGTIYAMEQVGNKLVFGGTFNQVGSTTRNRVAAIIPSAATPLVASYNPNASGIVWSIVPDADGSGAVYIGGTFATVGGASHVNLARLQASGTVDATFIGNTNGTVYALEHDGTRLFVGGAFALANSTARNKFAVVDDATGALGTYNAAIIEGNVRALVLRNGRLYVGGEFASWAGTYRTGTVALDAATLAIDNTWAGLLSGNVRTLESAGNYVFAGGSFASAGGVLRDRVAAIRLSTNAILTWAPNPNNEVFALEATGGSLYIGGMFTSIGGSTRTRLARYNIKTLALDGWNPGVSGGTSTVAEDILPVNGNIWVGGTFTTAGGSLRNNLAVFNSSGTVLSINPDVNNSVGVLALLGGQVVVGGSFGKVNNITRNRLASVDSATGSLSTFDPNVSGGKVLALAHDGTYLYAGGAFTAIGGNPRNRIARFDATLALDAWDPNASDDVRAFAISNGLLYVGGSFTSIGGNTRNRAASFELPSGNLEPFNPNFAGGAVYGAWITKGALLLSGNFLSAGGRELQGLANFPLTGLVAPIAQIDPDFCGETFGKQRLLGAIANSSVRTFEFEFSQGGSVVATLTSELNRRYVPLSGFAYGQSYSVRVRATGTGGTGPWSTACPITISQDPTTIAPTQLRTFDCGSTRNVSTGYVLAQRVPGATNYDFYIYSDAALTTLVATAANTGWRLDLGPLGLMVGSTYHITATATVDSISTAEGTACAVTMANAAPRTGLPTEAPTAYPNPTNNAWMVDVDGPATYQVLDIAGRVVARGTATGRTAIGANLPAGVYLLAVEGYQPIRVTKN